MKKKLAGSIIMCCVALAGCSSTQEEEDIITEAVAETESIDESSSEIHVEENVVETAWDGVITIGEYSFKIGDTIGDIIEQGWNGRLCQDGAYFRLDSTYESLNSRDCTNIYFDAKDIYIAPCSNGDTDSSSLTIYFDETQNIATWIHAINPYAYACPIEECVIEEVYFSGQDAKTFFPVVETIEDDGDAYFGAQNRVEGEYDYDYIYEYEEYTVDVFAGPGRTICVEWNKNAKEDFYYEEQYCYEYEQLKDKINPFTMGLHTYSFADMSKVSEITISYLSESNYINELCFDYHIDNNIYHVEMNPTCEVGVFMDLDEIYVNVKSGFPYIGSYEYVIVPCMPKDTYACRYDGNALMTISCSKADESDFTEEDLAIFLEDISTNLMATPISF